MNTTQFQISVLGSLLLIGPGCTETITEIPHCWNAEGNQTCMELFGGGFCSSSEPDCEGHGHHPYGCTFVKPEHAECYSPGGRGISCADDRSAHDPRCYEEVP